MDFISKCKIIAGLPKAALLLFCLGSLVALINVMCGYLLFFFLGIKIENRSKIKYCNCLNIRTPRNNKFYICSKWKINYFRFP